MGRKVFVSYKYGDTQVEALPGNPYTRVREYVDIFQALLDRADQISKGEADGEDLSGFKDETIESKLRDKIYDSSITVVFISKGMKNPYLLERDQWIPWEISYSLKEHSRNGRTSHTNAVLAVVLPDEYGRYDYFLIDDTCPNCHCTTYRTDFLFQILRENMFNRKRNEFTVCGSGSGHHSGYFSYIHAVKWSAFKLDVVKYLDIAATINANIDDYAIVKQVK